MASVGLAFVALSGSRRLQQGGERRQLKPVLTLRGFLSVSPAASRQVGPGVSSALGGLSWFQSQSYLWGQALNKADRLFCTAHVLTCRQQLSES